MRSLVLVLVALALSGCATVPPDALTASQGVDAAQAEVAAARTLVVRTQASSIAQMASQYQLENGTMAGFASDLLRFEPTLADGTQSLSDTSVSLPIDTSTCLVQPLPSGEQKLLPC